jgi:hypothetical protein
MDKRPNDRITNPEVLAETRRKGWPMTLECFADAAAVLDVPLWVPASDDGIARGLREMAMARRQNEFARQSQRYLREAGGLDPDPDAPPAPPASASSTTNPTDPPKPAPTAHKSASEMTDAEFSLAVRNRAWRR